MYNIKNEAEQTIIIPLQNAGYSAYFIGNYPFVKQNNIINNSDVKLKVKNIDIITDAPLEYLKKNFNIIETVDYFYNLYSIIAINVKQNIFKFRVFHPGIYINVVTKETFPVNNVNDIINNFAFLMDTIIIKNNNIINYTNKKGISSLDCIKQKSIISNGNFREVILKNPLCILELCYHACNMNYSINNSYYKIIIHNKSYLKYIKKSIIMQYLEKIIMSKNPYAGLNIIKNCLVDFEINNEYIFEFLKYIDMESLKELSNFKGIDIISRWAYILKEIPEDKRLEIINTLELNQKNKIIWIINNFDIVNQENYKMAIFNSRDSLKNIVECKYDVFLLYEMFERIVNMQCILYPDKEDKCKKFTDIICCRPFFEYQIRYSDEEICQFAHKENGDWLSKLKTDFIKCIIVCSKHPDEVQYKNILMECLKPYINESEEMK